MREGSGGIAVAAVDQQQVMVLVGASGRVIELCRGGCGTNRSEWRRGKLGLGEGFHGGRKE